MDGIYDFYEPENNIYIIKDKEGNIKKIFGQEEDLPIIRAINIMEARKEVGPAEITDKVFWKDFREGMRKVTGGRRLQEKTESS